MLNKLLKYDLKWTYKVLIVFYILSLISSIISRYLMGIENSMLFNIIAQITSGFTVAMVINAFINCLMRLWSRFVRNVYQDESYLTHTLPVEAKTIYASKVISAIICVFTTVLVSLISLFICYYSAHNLELLKDALEIAANTYNTTVFNFVFIVSFLIFLEIVFIILIGYVGIIIGHKSNKNKMVKTIIISFSLYMLTQIITLILIFIYGLLNPEVMNLIKTTSNISLDAIKNIMFLAIIIYTIYDLIYLFIGKIQLEKGINVD